MSLPIIPFVSDINVINKNIVYNDELIEQLSKNKSIKVSCICDVYDYELEECIRKIFESNKKVIFDTIQYSEKEQKVYFYTNKRISTQAWEDRKICIQNKQLSSDYKILEEIKHLLTSSKINRADCISLLDIIYVMKQTKSNYEELKRKYTNIFKKLLNKDYNNIKIYINNANKEDDELSIRFNCSGKPFGELDEIVVSKYDNQLYLKKYKTQREKQIFETISSELSKLYDEYVKYLDFKKQESSGNISINSNFNIYIDDLIGIQLYVPSSTQFFTKNFLISYSLDKKEYEFYSNSQNITDIVKGNENELLSRIFLEIENCPKRMQKQLYEIRKNQLSQEKTFEETEDKKPFILSKRKFPFFKK